MSAAPLTSSVLVAIQMFAGKTAARTPRIHQRANGLRVRAEITASPPTISATPLACTHSRWYGMYFGMIDS